MWIPTLNWKIAWERYYIISHLCSCQPKAFKDTFPVKLFQEWMMQKRHGGYEIEILQIYPLQRRALSKKRKMTVFVWYVMGLSQKAGDRRVSNIAPRAAPPYPFIFEIFLFTFESRLWESIAWLSDLLLSAALKHVWSLTDLILISEEQGLIIVPSILFKKKNGFFTPLLCVTRLLWAGGCVLLSILGSAQRHLGIIAVRDFWTTLFEIWWLILS